MTGLSLAAVLQVSLLVTGQTYSEARKASLETGRPLVILVGADWCPACRTMKDSTMPGLARSGGLKAVEFAKVNTDQQGELARRLMSGGSIPQLIVYHRTAEGWKRTGVVGAQSAGDVQAMIKQALAATVAPKAEEVAEKNEAKPGASGAVVKTSATGE